MLPLSLQMFNITQSFQPLNVIPSQIKSERTRDLVMITIFVFVVFPPIVA